MSRRRGIVFLVGWMLSVGCGGGSGSTSTTPARPGALDAGTDGADAGALAEFAHRIDNAETWRHLASQPDSSLVARAEVVKFLIDLEDHSKIYFVESRTWTIHYYFARDRLNHGQDHWGFNIEQYRRPTRRFVLGSLVHYLDPNVWTFELISGDNLEGTRIADAFERVRDAVYFGHELKFRPLSETHEREVGTVATRVPVLDTDALLATIRYQPLTIGATYGTIHIVHGRIDPATIAPTDIIVADHVPDDLPTCQGLITGVLQAPLAHVALLMQNRGSPNMTLRNATTDAELVRLDGHTVRLEVGPQDYRLSEIPRATAETAWNTMRPAPPVVPAADQRDRRIRELCTVNLSDVPTVGAKAAQLGAVCQANVGANTPGGFIVPMSFYFDHVAESGVGRSIPAMSTDQALLADRGARAQRLSELRGFLERANPDRRLVEDITRRIAALGSRRAILRSSTNAEDLVGFNGAGLYESVVIDANAGAAEVARALRVVWASVWTLRGFDEREWYRVPHTAVGMAVLVQPFLDDVAAIGVAVTANPFNPNRPAIFINVQARGGSVTGAGDTLPEQHMVYTYGETLEDEVISRSSITNGASVLTEPQVLNLAGVLLRLHNALANQITHDVGGALDVELVVRSNGEPVLLQARSAPRVPIMDQGPLR